MQNTSKQPKVGGEPFDPQSFSKKLTEANFVTRPPELERAMNKKFKPAGTPKKEGGLMVYPHF